MFYGGNHGGNIPFITMGCGATTPVDICDGRAGHNSPDSRSEPYLRTSITADPKK